MDKISILIADDHTLVRETWSFILNSDDRFTVVGECGNGEDAVRMARELRPDVVILDINMPGMNGIEAAFQIRKFAPGSRILGVSLHTQPSYARKMMQKGAMGYVTKSSSRDEMFTALLEVHGGRKYMCKEIKNNLSEMMIGGEEHQAKLSSLSQRELEIIDYIKKGNSSQEIANILNLSVKTVEVHRYNILKKLDLKNAAALVDYINRYLPL
ncbi:response regulator transcription factor [Paraflavisolibacter sp. H34]|uniref:response regulator transcription factor n=1 Tax=Huijunlia imazamoxiresistens TaxID=3127457 RepID=UPI0030191B4F